MPRGVYPRTANQLKAAKANLAKGRQKAARKKAAKTLRKLGQDPGWRERVSKGTKAAMRRPDVRKNHLEGLSAAFGYDYQKKPAVMPIKISAALAIADEYIQRFWARVQIRGRHECWPYLGHKNDKGYGEFWDGECGMLANRFVLTLKLGRRPTEDEHALHECDNPPCCNPRHIFLGDNAANVADKVRKGRQYRGGKK